MQFSKLRLLGFKSFVDPTELEIARGLTGVVGPNGCGKSNMLEALRWVMGENRPTAMRGAGMEDVIFSGASSRPARSTAEVTLYIEDLNGAAPPAFREHDKIDVVRRITRDIGSAYKVCGKDMRARDVQMLFADASTGAHSPSLVRQGQISELVNAKPKARRRILEEAAGISGLYQRRHEAELKLNGTETNLLRVEDTLEALQSQLTSLEKQAKQAARYRDLAAELRRMEAVLLYRLWSEAEAERATAAAALTEVTQETARRQGAALKAGEAREAADAALPPLREEETVSAAILQRFMVERGGLDDEDARVRETIRTLESRLLEAASDRDREASLGKDAESTIERLEWEVRELEAAGEGYAGEEAKAAEASHKTSTALLELEEKQGRATEALALREAHHRSLRARFEETETALARATEERERADAALAAAEAGIAAATARVAETEDAAVTAQAAANTAETELTEAEAALAAVTAEEATERAALSEAEGTRKVLSAERDGLQKVVARDSAGSGDLLNRVSVKPGSETAFGAALGDDINHSEAGDGTGWRALGGTDAGGLPAGAAPLGDEVEAPDVLARRLAATGLVDASEGARLQAALRPGQQLVSAEGDLWQWDGLHVAAADRGSSAGLTLQNRNRLAETEKALSTAEAAEETARAAHAKLAEALQMARTQERDARTRRKECEAAANAALRAASDAAAELSLLSGQRESQTQIQALRGEEAETAAAAHAEAEANLSGIADLEGDRAALEALKTDVEDARSAMLDARSAQDALRRAETDRVSRLEAVSEDLAGWRQRRASAGDRIAALDTRIAETDAALKTAAATPGTLEAQREVLDEKIEGAEARVKAARDALAEAEGALREADQAAREAERQASDARENRARAEATVEAQETRVADIAERVRAETGGSPEALLEAHELDPEAMPDADKAEIEVGRLRRQRDALGAVNLRAEEDAKAVAEELGTLIAERDDLVAAVEKLKGGIEDLNSEGRRRLIEAFDVVNRNFSELFTHLFNGGEAKLVLVESDDPLEAGLEIMCQPPGKKLSTLSLLSGGEQTLTALALIFAVFLANPSPICVLDEVDAPLDDANVTRFCDLLDRMTEETDTRFLIITHHAITMARMDRLFGVTMAEQGVSQLVSVDLNEAERIVDA